MYPLKLSVNPKGWRLFMRRRLDPQFAELSKRLFRRDQFVCQFCGVISKTNLEVINLDQDYSNNKVSNLVAACNFCTQCFFLESVGASGYGGGVLIYLPEIQQNYLNGLCHVLFTAMYNDTEYKETAQNAYRHLKLRSQILEEEWGDNMYEPALFGQLLIESGDKAIKSMLNKNIFMSIRLLPSRAAFKNETELDAISLLG
jgi:intracellular multiplication protein IcmJ